MVTVVTLHESPNISNAAVLEIMRVGEQTYGGQILTNPKDPQIYFIFQIDEDGKDFYDLLNEVYKLKVTKRTLK